MTHLQTSGHMRLVGHRDPEARHAWTTTELQQDVTKENKAAAGLKTPTLDPRWHLATQAYRQLQQGPLTPGQRERLIGEADGLGLRPFDASLIIAIAQDHARTGRPLLEAEPTLMLVNPASTRSLSHLVRWALASACALAATGFLLMWMAA